MEAIAILAVWYGIGLGTAWAMSRAGHDPFPWVLAGWLTGAWAAVAAVVWVRYQRRRADRETIDLTTTPVDRSDRRDANPRNPQRALRAGAGPARVRAA